jgi:solute carrier family 10 (sodium/bile acid cotransporter), member 7
MAQVGVLAMVLIGMVSTSQILKAESGLSISIVAKLAAICLAIHLAALWTGMCLARWMKMDRKDQIAVGFSGSQKTLMVGLFVCLLLGVSPLPMVIYHTIQLIVDTLIVDRFAARSFGDTALSDAGLDAT